MKKASSERVTAQQANNWKPLLKCILPKRKAQFASAPYLWITNNYVNLSWIRH